VASWPPRQSQLSAGAGPNVAELDRAYTGG